MKRSTEKYSKRRRLRRVKSFLALVVVFCTMYMLMLPAVGVEAESLSGEGDSAVSSLPDEPGESGEQSLSAIDGGETVLLDAEVRDTADDNDRAPFQPAGESAAEPETPVTEPPTAEQPAPEEVSPAVSEPPEETAPAAPEEPPAEDTDAPETENEPAPEEPVPEEEPPALTTEADAWLLQKLRVAVNRPVADDVPPMLTSAPAANEWQVVSGRYTGEKAVDAKIIQDEDGIQFRIQKNVVPTGRENEFYVYLNVEPVYYHDWNTIFRGSGMLVNNANNTVTYDTGYTFTPSTPIGEVKAGLGGVNSLSSMLVPDENYPLSSDYTDKTGKDIFIDTIELEREGADSLFIEDVNLVYSLSQNSAGSFTILYCPPNGTSCVKLSDIWWDGNGRGDKNHGGLLRFPAAAYNALIEANSEVFEHILQRAFPKVVTDPMGERITYLGVEWCSAGTAYRFDEAANTLIWDCGQRRAEPSQNREDYEPLGGGDAFARKQAYQLVYRVRLEVGADGFVSCADAMGETVGATVNPTNGATTLTYETDGDRTERTGDFPVPAVRGLLYDVVFRKVDEEGNPLGGATFALLRRDDRGQYQATGRMLTTGDTGELCRFEDLPWGDYILRETAAPEGYTGNRDWPVSLCYTTAPDTLTQDGDRPANLRYCGQDEAGVWTIVNGKDETKITLKKVDEADREKALPGAVFTLTRLDDPAFALTLTSGEDGFLRQKGAEDSTFTLSGGTYALTELTAPAGYDCWGEGEQAVLTVGADVRYSQGTGDTVSVAADADGVYTVFVTNRKGAVLPETGGTGTVGFYLAGVLLAGSAVGWAVVKRRDNWAG